MQVRQSATQEIHIDKTFPELPDLIEAIIKQDIAHISAVLALHGERLSKAYYDIKTGDRLVDVILNVAVKCGNMDLIEKILQEPYNANPETIMHTTELGRHAIFHVAMHPELQVRQQLLHFFKQRGNNLLAPTSRNSNILLYSLQIRNAETNILERSDVIKFLIDEAVIKVDDIIDPINQFNLVMTLYTFDNLEILQYLAMKGVDIDPWKLVSTGVWRGHNCFLLSVTGLHGSEVGLYIISNHLNKKKDKIVQDGIANLTVLALQLYKFYHEYNRELLTNSVCFDLARQAENKHGKNESSFSLSIDSSIKLAYSVREFLQGDEVAIALLDWACRVENTCDIKYGNHVVRTKEKAALIECMVLSLSYEQRLKVVVLISVVGNIQKMSLIINAIKHKQNDSELYSMLMISALLGRNHCDVKYLLQSGFDYQSLNTAFAHVFNLLNQTRVYLDKGRVIGLTVNAFEQMQARAALRLKVVCEVINLLGGLQCSNYSLYDCRGDVFALIMDNLDYFGAQCKMDGQIILPHNKLKQLSDYKVSKLWLVKGEDAHLPSAILSMMIEEVAKTLVEMSEVRTEEGHEKLSSRIKRDMMLVIDVNCSAANSGRVKHICMEKVDNIAKHRDKLQAMFDEKGDIGRVVNYVSHNLHYLEHSYVDSKSFALILLKKAGSLAALFEKRYMRDLGQDLRAKLAEICVPGLSQEKYMAILFMTFRVGLDIQFFEEDILEVAQGLQKVKARCVDGKHMTESQAELLPAVHDHFNKKSQQLKLALLNQRKAYLGLFESVKILLKCLADKAAEIIDLLPSTSKVARKIDASFNGAKTSFEVYVQQAALLKFETEADLDSVRMALTELTKFKLELDTRFKYAASELDQRLTEQMNRMQSQSAASASSAEDEPLTTITSLSIKKSSPGSAKPKPKIKKSKQQKKQAREALQRKLKVAKADDQNEQVVPTEVKQDRGSLAPSQAPHASFFGGPTPAQEYAQYSALIEVAARGEP